MVGDEKQHHWVLPSTPHHTERISTTYPYRDNDNARDFDNLDDNLDEDDDTAIEGSGYQSFPFLPDTPAVKRHQLSELFLPLPSESATSSSSMASFVKDSFVMNRITSVLPSVSGVLSKVQNLHSLFCNSQLMQGLAEEALATPGLSESARYENHKPSSMAATTTTPYPSATNMKAKTVLKPICFHRSSQKDEANVAYALNQQTSSSIAKTKQQHKKLPPQSGKSGRRHYPPLNSVEDAVLTSQKPEMLLELVPLRGPTSLLRTTASTASKASSPMTDTTRDGKSKQVVEDGFEFISRAESLLDLDKESDAVEMMQHPKNDAENIPPTQSSRHLLLASTVDGKQHNRKMNIIS